MNSARVCRSLPNGQNELSYGFRFDVLGAFFEIQSQESFGVAFVSLLPLSSAQGECK
jgi:hypothetical protein